MKNGPFVRVTGTMLLIGVLDIVAGVSRSKELSKRAPRSRARSRVNRKFSRRRSTLRSCCACRSTKRTRCAAIVLTRDPFYVGAVSFGGAPDTMTKENAIRRTLRERSSLPDVARAARRLRALQSEWRNSVAAPLLAHPHERLQELDKRNKLFSDYETLTAAAIRRALAGTDDALARSTQLELDRSSYVRAFWVLVFGLFAIVFNAYRSRLNRELEEERALPRFCSARSAASRCRCPIARSEAPICRQPATWRSAATFSTSIASPKAARCF